MKFARKDIIDCVESLLDSDRKSAVIFAAPLGNVKGRVRATRRFKPHKRNRSTDIILTLGALNYQERELIARCRRAKCKPRRLWFPPGGWKK